MKKELEDDHEEWEVEEEEAASVPQLANKLHHHD
jgi:hypothetical protein